MSRSLSLLGLGHPQNVDPGDQPRGSENWEMAWSGGQHLKSKVNSKDSACLPHGTSKVPLQRALLLLYQMVHRWSSRFCCRMLWFFIMVSSSFFTAGESDLSLAMNSLGLVTWLLLGLMDRRGGAGWVGEKA